MFNLNDSNRFFLYPYPTDMRKSFYSLSGIVTNLMGMNVQDGDAYIFINKSGSAPFVNPLMSVAHVQPQ